MNHITEPGRLGDGIKWDTPSVPKTVAGAPPSDTDPRGMVPCELDRTTWSRKVLSADLYGDCVFRWNSL